MDTTILIKLLDDIDFKLRHSTRKEQKTFKGNLSGRTMMLPAIKKELYSVDEIMTMHERKSGIIQELFIREAIDDDSYKEYLLSEDARFTPKIIFTTVRRQRSNLN